MNSQTKSSEKDRIQIVLESGGDGLRIRPIGLINGDTRTEMKNCGCGDKGFINVGFPDCRCHYTIDDNGIHMCPLHASAERMKEFIEKLVPFLGYEKESSIYKEAQALLKEIGE